MCAKCNTTKAYSDEQFVESGEVQEMLDSISMRVFAEPALRQCDDPDGWDWRNFLKARATASAT